MKEYRTNLALVMDIFDISSSRLAEDIGADRSLVSRWKNGNRKIMPNRHWADKLTFVFLEYDKRLKTRPLTNILEEYYNICGMTVSSLAGHFKNWLCAPRQNSAGENARRMSIYLNFVDRWVSHPQAASREAGPFLYGHASPSTSASGYYECLNAIYGFFNHISSFGSPLEITLVCPSGIDLITRESSFSIKMLRMLSGMFDAGFRLKAILRTDFRISDVALYSGKWMVSHLKGYIKSLYYDEFRKVDADKIIIMAEDAAAIRIFGDDYNYEFYSGAGEVCKVRRICDHYTTKSRPRFRYDFFRSPGNYLQGLPNGHGAHSWLFQHLPHFPIGGGKIYEKLGLSQSEAEYIRKQFPIVRACPEQHGPDFQIRHALCMDSIEEALDKPKHLCFELSDMLGRRVYMDTQFLVDQLCAIKRLKKQFRNYSVCFLDASVFGKIAMEIAVHGKNAAICWLRGQMSTATHDYITVSALNGFCADVWGKIPAASRSEAAAKRCLAKLLHRAEKFGDTVD
jgi:hypothetical protein